MENKGTEMFIRAIKNYLENRAANDAAFAEKFKNEKKTVDGCAAFIIDQVQKSKRCAYADEEIFGLAVHYYDEEDIKECSMPNGVKIVGPYDLTDEEKQEAKAQAMAEYRDKMMAEATRNDAANKLAKNKKPATALNNEQLSLF